MSTARVDIAGQTAQTRVWQGEFGRAYTDRNTLEMAELDALWSRNYGVSRSAINQMFLEGIPRSASFLEVGCNVGNQLLLLQAQGYTQLTGIELQSYALAGARSRLKNVALQQGSALALPFEDQTFDVVFTSGVLIHIAPDDLPQAMSEIHRCARHYIWGAEYFSSELTAVNYRGNDDLLWKMDYARKYLTLFDDLELVKERRFQYLENDNVDTVFLLKKSKGTPE
ncbi:MAG TPA: pseudaminic acid biosynthesis-associated methylase [Terriglobales bacterium]|nr:pseudaminic acid biosynthesis-associated methylase [Terriglobales bacterium]HXS78325.1 pseudaminic acid biosynthesis-associated methylase [Terracidiphilus sp.]